jgi:methylenetetrahydrofolate dehydrogenase (NADP+) / methenyltetrahydrofolate cyclohydrolase
MTSLARIIDGKAHAQAVRQEIGAKVARLKQQYGKAPGLAVVLVGEDPASQIYVRMKNKACTEAGMLSMQHHRDASTSEDELLALVHSLNADPTVHGILVQLPLPKHINEDTVIETISPEKDVDGFHPINVGRLMNDAPIFAPCTPLGVMALLDREGVDPKGKRAVVVGRSMIVGKPMALLLLARHATVTICHSRTADLAGEVRNADILVAAIGKPNMIKGEWIKEGAVVIDVGVNRLPDGKLAGDVEFEGASQRASRITPVPGGVGPMTIALLLSNTLTAAERAFAGGGRE